MEAALHNAALTQAARGLGQVLQLTKGQRVPTDLVGQLLGELEKLPGLGGELVVGSAAPGEAAREAAGAEAATAPEEEDGEGEEAPLVATEQLLGLLTLTGELQASSSSSGGGAAAEAAAERQQARLVHSVGALLKEAVNSPAACPALWGLLGRWHAMQDNLESAKEAWLKQVGVAGRGM